jgi:hypothetical protein
MDFPHPVPSIATQYIRNRKQHDATARQWTENYARPKPSPLPPVAVEAPPSPKFTKAKGKKFADSGPSNTAGCSSSTTRPTRSAVVASSSATAASVSAQRDVIFPRPDEEMAGPSNGKDKKRTRGEAYPAAAPVGDANEVADWLDSVEKREDASARGLYTPPPFPAGLRSDSVGLDLSRMPIFWLWNGWNCPVTFR